MNFRLPLFFAFLSLCILFAKQLGLIPIDGLSRFFSEKSSRIDTKTNPSLGIISANQKDAVFVAEKDESEKYKSEIYQKINSFRKKNHTNKKIKESVQKQESYHNKYSASKKRFHLAMRAFGRPKEYERLLRESLDLDPRNLLALGRLAEHLLAKKEIVETRELAANCIAMDPKNKLCHQALISSFTRFGEFDESYHYLQDCIVDVPDSIPCHAGLFTYYLALKKEREAEYYLDIMERISPSSLSTIIAKGNMEHFKENFAEARRFYSQACDIGNPYACRMLREIKL